MNKIFIYVLLLIHTGCVHKSNDSGLNQALILSGANRTELEKVLQHYNNDSLKLEAAKFLIKNMPGSFSINAEILQICQPFYQSYDSLAKLYNYGMNIERGKKIDSLWNRFSLTHREINVSLIQPDIEYITSERLIAEIDQAFKVWKENVYTRDYPFDVFCEYILPYRQMNGLIIDDARKTIYFRHHDKYFKNPKKNILREVDSLLYTYRHLAHSGFWGVKIPIYSIAVFEHLRQGLCGHRCWFNSILLSSLGIPAAVDFIPSWGNRNSSHSWNTLIENENSHAFEAFWEEEKWRYKQIYNNKTFDYQWGVSRLPKVFRHSFKNYPEGPVIDKRVKQEDIPTLFKNIKKKDVSHEYFETTDIEIPLVDIPKKTYYAYLCVLNYLKWEPVQWGKIEDGKAIFRGMGRDIIYLPCYYEKGSFIPAAEPFLLNSKGAIETFRSDTTELERIYIRDYIGVFLYSRNKPNIESIAQTKISGDLSPVFTDSDTIGVLPNLINIYNDKITSFSDRLIRYVRIHLPTQTFAFNNLTFFHKDSTGKEQKIKNISLLKPLASTGNGEITDYIFDDHISTGYKIVLDKKYIDIDLGEKYKITSICFAPYLESGLYKNRSYELFYWNKGWASISRQQGSNKHLIFEHVPKGALLLLKPNNVNVQKPTRYFIYKNNEVRWY